MYIKIKLSFSFYYCSHTKIIKITDFKTNLTIHKKITLIQKKTLNTGFNSLTSFYAIAMNIIL